MLSQRFGFSPNIIYPNDFYVHEVNGNQAASAEDVGKILVDLFSPQSVIDVGCGNGIYLRSLAKRKVLTIGCDGSIHGVRLCPPETFVFQHDLRLPLVVNRRSDLCICFEVAEHIPKKYSHRLVQSCCRASDTVCFSSAQVGQSGTDHINEQPNQYWDKHFRREGFMISADDTNKLQIQFRNRNVVNWLGKNTRVYRKLKEAADKVPKLSLTGQKFINSSK